MAVSRFWRGQDKRAQAFDVLAISRRERISLREAAARYNVTQPAGQRISVRTVRRHVPGAVEKRGGRFYARRYDRARRDPMRVLTTEGERYVVPYSSSVASAIGRQQNALRVFIEGPGTPQTEQARVRAMDDLERLQRRPVRGYDPDTGDPVEYEMLGYIPEVDSLARRGAITTGSPYKRPNR
jgi:hypothetical protein